MGWFSKSKSAPQMQGTDEAWVGLLQSILVYALRDWQRPNTPIDTRMVSDVARYVLYGAGGGLTVLKQALQAAPNNAAHFDNEGRRYLAELALAHGPAELDRWERFVHVLAAIQFRRTPGASIFESALLPFIGEVGPGRPGETHPMTVRFLVALAERFGYRSLDLVEHAMTPARNAWSHSNAGLAMSRMSDWGQAAVFHSEVVVPRLATGSVDERVRAMAMLEHLDTVHLTHFAGALAEASTATSAKVREAALPLLKRADLDAVLACLTSIARGGKPDTRVQALSLMWVVAEDRPVTRHDAREIAAADRAASVQALLGQWDAADATPVSDDWVLPEQPPLVWGLEERSARRLATRLVEGLTREVDQINHSLEKVNRNLGHLNPGVSNSRQRPDPREADRIATALASRTAPTLTPDVLDEYGQVPNAVGELLDDPDMTAAVLLQCIAEVRRIGLRDGRTFGTELVEGLHARTDRPTLLELQRLLDDAGLSGADIVWKRYSRTWRSLARTWPDEDVWPFVASNLDTVLDEKRGDTWNTDPEAMYRALVTLPSTPARVVERLYDAALGSTKADRARAQAALAKRSDRSARAGAALSSGKADTRLAAAQWLTELADPEAVPDLAAAYKKEKQETVRGALLDALEASGQDPRDHLSRESLIADAEASIAKGMPKDLAWLAWDSLPEVRWADGAQVPRSLLQGLAVQAVKAKSPEPNAIVRRACAMFDRADAERLAERLLAAWLAEDLKPAPGGPPDQPGGSATTTKGLLAIVGACGGQRVVAPSERYLREWYGMRASQGKALLAMLSWVDHPSATQLVLSVGSRFRTKTFQEEAVRLAAALAERKGWTLDELADRTIPTAGFEGDGLLSLPYGERVFTARLQPDLTVELSDPDGKVVKSLPQPRQTDDAELAKESKKTLAGAKKELKDIARLQHDRLYEALCTGRSWLAADWLEHLAGHPVIRHQIQRLVWVGKPVEGDGLITFRLLEDATLTDVDDEPVELDPTWRVSLAHQTTLPPEDSDGWATHLSDYEVSPLFQQFGKQVYELPEELRHESEVKEFTGHVLEAFQLRGRALKLGWSRGPVEDAGWFHCYEKRFPTLGVVARLGFSGNGVPEENRTVALTQLAFLQTHADSPRGSSMMLRDVPAVLLSECRHDLAAIASLGPGYDENWEKTVQW